jgi:hypothetical protein
MVDKSTTTRGGGGQPALVLFRSKGARERDRES